MTENEVSSILEKVKTGELATKEALKALLPFFGDNRRFIAIYKTSICNNELVWETRAKNLMGAVDIFWKTHDVLDTLISLKEV